MSKFMVQVTYGGRRNPKSRYFGSWLSRVAAQKVAYSWTSRVSSHFFGDLTFAVVEIEDKTIGIKALRQLLRDEGMN
jgi:hypothetical protein